MREDESGSLLSSFCLQCAVSILHEWFILVQLVVLTGGGSFILTSTRRSRSQHFRLIASTSPISPRSLFRELSSRGDDCRKVATRIRHSAIGATKKRDWEQLGNKEQSIVPPQHSENLRTCRIRFPVLRRTSPTRSRVVVEVASQSVRARNGFLRHPYQTTFTRSYTVQSQILSPDVKAINCRTRMILRLCIPFIDHLKDTMMQRYCTTIVKFQ